MKKFLRKKIKVENPANSDQGQPIWSSDVRVLYMRMGVLESDVCATGSDFFRFETGQRIFIEDFSIFTSNESGMTSNASNETIAFSGDCVTWEWPEFVSEGVRLNYVGATEANDLLRIANIQKKIWPIASVFLFSIS